MTVLEVPIPSASRPLLASWEPSSRCVLPLFVLVCEERSKRRADVFEQRVVENSRGATFHHRWSGLTGFIRPEGPGLRPQTTGNGDDNCSGYRGCFKGVDKAARSESNYRLQATFQQDQREVRYCHCCTYHGQI